MKLSNEDTKNLIIKLLGYYDGPTLVEKLQEYGVEDIDLIKGEMIITVSQIKNFAKFQKELSTLSKVGRSFLSSLEGDSVKIKMFAMTFEKMDSEGSHVRNHFPSILADIPFMTGPSPMPQNKTIDKPHQRKGSIHGIWLTTKNGSLHPAIIPNLSQMISAAHKFNFNIVLWSNLNELSSIDKEKLSAENIVVKDHTECKNSIFYPYFMYFLNLGIAGDKAAFALASDILRMSILELMPEDEYFIYADPNDIKFQNLKESLLKLDLFMKINTLGFSFFIEKLTFTHMHLRNDVLIALKEKNTLFFNDYLKAYHAHLEKNYGTYRKPETDLEAQNFATQITMSTSLNFFNFKYTQDNLRAISTFGNYSEKTMLIHCVNFFPHTRIFQNANTWLPQGKCLEEQARMAKFGMKPSQRNMGDSKTSLFSSKETISTSFSHGSSPFWENSSNIDNLMFLMVFMRLIVEPFLSSHSISSKENGRLKMITMNNELEKLNLLKPPKDIIKTKIQRKSHLNQPDFFIIPELMTLDYEKTSEDKISSKLLLDMLHSLKGYLKACDSMEEKEKSLGFRF